MGQSIGNCQSVYNFALAQHIVIQNQSKVVDIIQERQISVTRTRLSNSRNGDSQSHRPAFASMQSDQCHKVRRLNVHVHLLKSKQVTEQDGSCLGRIESLNVWTGFHPTWVNMQPSIM